MQRTILSLDQENKKLKEKLNSGNVGASDSRPGSARVHTELQASQPGQQSSYQDSDKSHRVILRLESQVAQLTQELTLAQSGSTGASSPARVGTHVGARQC